MPATDEEDEWTWRDELPDAIMALVICALFYFFAPPGPDNIVLAQLGAGLDALAAPFH